jgi:hypothetical protein
MGFLLLARNRSSFRMAMAFIMSRETYMTVPRPKRAILEGGNYRKDMRRRWCRIRVVARVQCVTYLV